MKKLIGRKMFAYGILFIFFTSSIFLASCKNNADGNVTSKGMRPDSMGSALEYEYNHIEDEHKTSVEHNNLLTEWSCDTGDFYQYLIFNEEIPGLFYYGSYINELGKTPSEAKKEAKKKAEESKAIFEDGFGRQAAENDCSTGYATVKGDKIIFSIFPNSSTSKKPDSFMYIDGTFYVSPSGRLIVRPATGNDDEVNFKIGFIKEK